MAPPLHDPIATLHAHDDLDTPPDAATAVTLQTAMARLRSMETARGGKSVGRGEGGHGTLQELRPGSDREWLRIYYTVTCGAAIVLHWGAKKNQDADLVIARRRCAEIEKLGKKFEERCTAVP